MSLLKNDTLVRDVFKKQDNLYTILERTPLSDRCRVMKAIMDFHLVPDNVEVSIAKLANPETKIVSFTITESGYYVS